jgi:formylmethanofuran dehydrogenase subunit B
LGAPLSESAQTDHIVADVPCPFCACLCDDLEVTVAGGRIAAAANACELARPQFLAARDSERGGCRIAGQTATLDKAICRAAEILQRARYPLIWGLGRATCEAQAAAIEIAERLGGTIDSAGAGDFDALQTVGEITSTLGEVRSRADLVLVWSADPATDQPRFFERYAPQLLGQSGGCPLVVVDSRVTPTAAAAGRHLKIHAGREFESATVLWALAKGLSPNPAQVAEQTGVSLADWQALLASMEQSRYGALLCVDSSTEPSFLPPLYGLVRTLNDRTRWVCLRLSGVSNGAGAEQVLTWRTGYPNNINFSHGYPRYNPSYFDAGKVLERGEADAALVVCDDPRSRLSSAAQARLQKIPTVSIDWQETSIWSEADVAIRVAVPGVESAGTMFRFDGVPLALRPAIESSDPADFEVMRLLTAAVADHGPGSDSFFGR